MFKIGDRVALRKSSVYCEINGIPSGSLGTIKSVYGISEIWYSVEWDNYKLNGYQDEDLYLATNEIILKRCSKK